MQDGLTPCLFEVCVSFGIGKETLNDITCMGSQQGGGIPEDMEKGKNDRTRRKHYAGW